MAMHELSVGFVPGEPKRMRVDGATVERLLDVSERPLVSVFLPDRLELIKGAPTLRRAHLDQFVAALWPARAATRRAYAQTLAQRNALIARIRTGSGSRASLDDLGPAAGPARDRADGRSGCGSRARLRGVLPAGPGDWGSTATLNLHYRPRSHATDAEQLAAELLERLDGRPRCAASPATAPTATTCQCCATGASFASTGRRASSAWRCSRCCWPSARQSPPPETPRL